MTDPAPPRPVTPASILAARLDTLLEQAENEVLGDLTFRQTLAEAQALSAGLDPYLAAHTTPASAALTTLAEATTAEDWTSRFERADTGQALEAEMLSGHVEGQALKMLTAATGARRVLEVGLFTGYSALAMAEGLPADGRLTALEIDDFAADFAARHFRASKPGHKIDIRRGPAADSLAQLAEEGAVFDLVFIDADKAGYIDYLNTILDGHLLAGNGLICVDNTLMQGQPWLTDADNARSANGQAIAAFNESVMADPRLESVLLPLRDGLTLIRRRDD